MSIEYYIHDESGRQGPFDLPMMMRKARSGAIAPTSPVSTNEDPAPRMAADVTEIAALFTAPKQGGVAEPKIIKEDVTAEKRITRSLSSGWKFAGQQPIMFVIASAAIMASLGVGTLFSTALGWQMGIAISVMSLFVMQNIVMVLIQRFYRGQYLDSHFLSTRFAPALWKLVFSGIITAAFGLAGLIILILPGIFLFSLFAFTPLIIADTKCSVIKGMAKSASMTLGSGIEFFGAVMALLFLNILSLVLIVTLPLTMPIVAVALAELYDEAAR